MLLILLGITVGLVGVSSLIPPSNVCYQHTVIQNACNYGNITVVGVGKTFKPQDCNSHIDIKDIEHAPYIYINSTNSTERFTVLMQDLGPLGLGPTYLQWMVTNVSINTPDYQRIPINNILAPYEKPLMLHGHLQPHLVQILVFRHWNTLRVPFGELWVTRKQNFQISTLFSNTSPTLRLCGPVAGIQLWVHDNMGSSYTPSAPLPPVTGQQGSPVYVPVVPVVPVGQPGYNFAPGQSHQGYVPVGLAPGQPGYVPVGSAPGQPGYSPMGQPGYNPQPQNPSHVNHQRVGKSAASIYEPLRFIFVPLVVIILAM